MIKRYLFVVVVMLPLVACSTPPDHVANPHTPPLPEAGSTSRGFERPKKPLAVKIITAEDVAKEIGVHPDFLYVTNNACARALECTDLVADIDVCERRLAETWCADGGCDQGFLNRPVFYDRCRLDIWERSCAELARPIQCGGFEKLGLVLSPTAWPDETCQTAPIANDC